RRGEPRPRRPLAGGAEAGPLAGHPAAPARALPPPAQGRARGDPPRPHAQPHRRRPRRRHHRAGRARGAPPGPPDPRPLPRRRGGAPRGGLRRPADGRLEGAPPAHRPRPAGRGVSVPAGPSPVRRWLPLLGLSLLVPALRAQEATGTYFVYLGSFTTKAAAQAHARRHGGWVLRTDLYRGLTPGYFAAVRGPFAERADAEAALALVQSDLPDALVRDAGAPVLPRADR